MNKEETRALVKDAVTDLASNLLYYGRKDDEELTFDRLNRAMLNGWITPEELGSWFATSLRENKTGKWK